MTGESKRHRQDWQSFSSHVHPVDDSTDEWLSVYHIMHCWPMKGHAKAQTVSYLWYSNCLSYLFNPQPMTPSGVRSATHQMCQQTFLTRTIAVTVIASCISQHFFPKNHKRALKRFKAGCYLGDDVGPWLGRALGYKVPTTTHPDEGDSGTTFITAVGSYLEGCLELHNLEVRFTYQPGHMALGEFGNFLHRVSAWQSTKASGWMADAMERHNLTPGRVFLVMFNKSETDERLEGKPAGWGRHTRFGADEIAPKIK